MLDLQIWHFQDKKGGCRRQPSLRWQWYYCSFLSWFLACMFECSHLPKTQILWSSRKTRYKEPRLNLSEVWSSSQSQSHHHLFFEVIFPSANGIIKCPYADPIILINEGTEEHLSTSILTMSCSQPHGLLARHYFLKHATNKFLPSKLTPLWIGEHSQEVILYEANGIDLHSGCLMKFYNSNFSDFGIIESRKPFFF